jgi:hypothetical protein
MMDVMPETMNRQLIDRPMSLLLTRLREVEEAIVTQTVVNYMMDHQVGEVEAVDKVMKIKQLIISAKRAAR